MKIKPFLSVVILVGSLLVTPVVATSVATSTVEQPVNLGTRSDPTRIPLGPVGVVCNYYYGLHHFIGEARPAPDGAMRWSGGSELDQNLASVFGISVEPADSSQIPALPVFIRVKPWKAPGYTPYTKEQVVAATLWCLLRRVDSTPATPLEVRVVAESEDDKALEARYSGKYITRPSKDDGTTPPLSVPGTLLEEDSRGIAWVVFPDAKKNDTFIPINPSVVVLKSGGDGDPGWHVLPVWGNGNDESDFLRLNHWSSNICYSAFKSHGVSQANSYVGDGGADTATTEPGSMDILYPRVDPATLAANLLALVISKQPTEAKPLTISFTVEESAISGYSSFRNDESWHESRPDADKVMLKCEFVWDAAARKLTKGSIPLVKLDGKNWIIPNPVQETALNEPKEQTPEEAGEEAGEETEEAGETKASE
ncbi:hypothetical protein JIN84_18640 [Luteolibacter yonseiensis]|uniref:Uncharacterized protein n=1 Tax=Luteolibacter yonseiensis TaxID=1144680 RepID=A0A934VDK2_9BACT|nr:hypothetical protein [Luteolibacter yonseiensis]MBK1817644.1 hypothetical protein [Luteolibacter yonseiensis]